MRIGDLAESPGTAVETLRFYERGGRIPVAWRADNNCRMYTAAHVERRAFIRHCRNLDMALDEIRTLLRLGGPGNRIEGREADCSPPARHSHFFRRPEGLSLCGPDVLASKLVAPGGERLTPPPGAPQVTWGRTCQPPPWRPRR